jgi:cholesterol transport system auxiliary component
MRPPLMFLRVAAALGLTGLLAGCVSVLPKSDPVQLYAFEGAAAPPSPAAAPAAGKPFDVMRGIGSFNRAAAGDRILTTDGAKVAYIGKARWVAPAVVLFDQALSRAFDDSQGPARLLGRGQVGKAEYVLRLDVRDFEARYENGLKAAPVVLIRARASLTDSQRALVGDKMFEVRVPAADNRVGAIAEAFDKAVGQMAGELVTWTNAAGAPATS